MPPWLIIPVAAFGGYYMGTLMMRLYYMSRPCADCLSAIERCPDGCFGKWCGTG